MNRSAAYRGQPVLVLLVVVVGWCVVRAALWQVPFPAPLAAATGAASHLVAPLVRAAGAAERGGISRQRVVLPARPREPMRREPIGDPAPTTGWALVAMPAVSAGFAPVSPRIADEQALLFAAAFSHFEVVPRLAALVARGRATPTAIPAFPLLAGDTARAPARRWSGDAWLLLRQDTTTPVTSGRGSYGRSQAGAVLRYRLDADSPHRPAAYARVSSAIGGERDAEVALGLIARPLAGMPIALAAEMRATRAGEGSEARPAAFAYSEIPPLKLPFDARGEAYFQAGYVGGHFATAFVDGQVRVDREIAHLGPAKLRAGGGAWGGAQKGAKRLDVGPGATVVVGLGGTPLRVAADWRFRVAGEANPSSGPALTVSTGF